MSRSIRAQNLFLARSMLGSQTDQVLSLGGTVSETTLTRQAQGKKQISDPEAERYERSFALPAGWLDRKNEELLRMSTEEYELIAAVINLGPEQKEGLRNLLGPPGKK